MLKLTSHPLAWRRVCRRMLLLFQVVSRDGVSIMIRWISRGTMCILIYFGVVEMYSLLLDASSTLKYFDLMQVSLPYQMHRLPFQEWAKISRQSTVCTSSINPAARNRLDRRGTHTRCISAKNLPTERAWHPSQLLLQVVYGGGDNSRTSWHDT